ncbi:hypothetical protein VTI74DRAFT_3434 [Chaetomium olivicolor]
MVTNCNKFARVNTGDTCDALAFWNGMESTEQFKLWNYGVDGYCQSLKVDHYVCVGLLPNPISPTNGVPTPQPTNPGAINGMESTEQFILWNPSVGSQCKSLQANTYVCVGLVPSSNGIKTPQPTHPGIAGNCKKFARMNQGDTCDLLAFWNGISTQQFISWNTGAYLDFGRYLDDIRGIQGDRAKNDTSYQPAGSQRPLGILSQGSFGGSDPFPPLVNQGGGYGGGVVRARCTCTTRAHTVVRNKANWAAAAADMAGTTVRRIEATRPALAAIRGRWTSGCTTHNLVRNLFRTGETTLAAQAWAGCIPPAGESQ